MEINETLIQLIHMTKEIEGLDFFMGEAELSKTEFRLLREILLERKKGKEIISSELARRLGITRSAVSQIVSKLEGKHIIKRIPSATDKKIAYVQFTEEAIEAFERHCACANRFMAAVVAEYGEERIKNFVGDFRELLKIMENVKNRSKGNKTKNAETTGN